MGIVGYRSGLAHRIVTPGLTRSRKRPPKRRIGSRSPGLFSAHGPHPPIPDAHPHQQRPHYAVRRRNERPAAPPLRAPHRKDKNSFAWNHQCWTLVYFEPFKYVKQAIAREKQLKNWKREWKEALIAEEDPSWSDLRKDPADRAWFARTTRLPGSTRSTWWSSGAARRGSDKTRCDSGSSRSGRESSTALGLSALDHLRTAEENVEEQPDGRQGCDEVDVRERFMITAADREKHAAEETVLPQ